MGSNPTSAVVPVSPPRLGHAVLKVRDLERALTFYRDTLGLLEVARLGSEMVFLSSGQTHHELALVRVAPGEQAGSPDRRQVGLHHLAFRVGAHLDTLRAWRDRLQGMGIPILGLSDHRVSQSIYLRDPDGLLIELYVDADPAIWRADPAAVAHVAPLCRSMPAPPRPVDALLGSLVADALAMPVHWYYDRSALVRDYGQPDHCKPPRTPHPDSILGRSSYQALNQRGEILHDQAADWGY